MNLFALSGLLNFISSLVFGFFVFFHNRKSRAFRLWLAFSLSVALWELGVFAIGLTAEPQLSLFFWRMAYIGVILIPVFFTQFIYSWLQIKRKFFSFFVWAFGLFFSAVNLWDLFFNTGFFIPGVRWIFNSFYYNVPQPLYSIFVVLWFFLVLYAHYELLKAYKDAIGIRRRQIQYFIFAFIVAFGGGATCYLVVYGINFYPYFNFTAPFYPLIMSYAILKYRLMDIRIVIKLGTIFSALVLAVSTAYVFVAFLLGSLFYPGQSSDLTPSLVTGFVVAVLTAVGFRPLYSFLEKTTDRYLFKGEYKPQDLIKLISDESASVLETEKIISIAGKEIREAMRLKSAEIKILAKGAPENNLIKYLKEKKETLSSEEMKRQYGTAEKYDQRYLAYRDLEESAGSLAVPIYDKSEKLAALLLAGEKKSGDVFTPQDIKTLEIIAAQAGVALENARMYEEMKDFSKTLQKEVARQTEELKNTNVRLEQLDKAKSEFISIASHQLRTPLTSIKGLISMALEDFWGPLNENQRKYLTQVYESGERLLKLIENLLDISRMEAGRMEFIFQPVNLLEIAKEVAADLLPQAGKKNLALNLAEPAPGETLPKVRADQLKIRQVIQNLIDNAIKYTQKGEINIRLEKENGSLVFSVSDTGMGFSAEDKANLFEKFQRGRGVETWHTEGTGLGLYLAAKIVEAHGGKIWAESAGKFRGSTFSFSLPVIK